MLVIILYVFVSVAVSKNNQFVNYNFNSSESIIDSKYKQLFISKIELSDINYNLNKKHREYFKSNVVFWIDKYRVSKSFGMFNLFTYSIENSSYFTLYVGLKNPNDKYKSEIDNQYLLKIKNADFETFSTFPGLKVDNNSIVKIEILTFDTKKKLGEICIRIKLNNPPK